MPEPKNCTRCEQELSQEERSSPYRDEDADNGVICDECWREHYCFSCFWCDEYAENVDGPGHLFVIAEECGGPSHWRC